MEKKIVIIIPARYRSSRFSGKPLALINNKPMIQWVYERVSYTHSVTAVYVATDDDRIFESVMKFGGKAIMTGNCACGTERVFQACKDLEADVVINVQGDEPLISHKMIEKLVSAFEDDTVQMATLKKVATMDEINNPNVVKVITDNDDNAIYFSRSVIPYNRDNSDVIYFKHIGIYGYRKAFLEKFVSLPLGNMEKIECLEQLRAIENGYKIRVITTEYQSVGVDCPDDIKRVLEQMKKEGIY